MVRAHAPRQVTDENHEGGLDLSLRVLKHKKMLVKADAAGRLFLLAFLLYPGLTTKLFEGFICRDIGLGDLGRRRRRHSAPALRAPAAPRRPPRTTRRGIGALRGRAESMRVQR